MNLEGLRCGRLPFDEQNLKPFKDHSVLTQHHPISNGSFPQISNHLYSVDSVIFYRVLF